MQKVSIKEYLTLASLLVAEINEYTIENLELVDSCLYECEDEGVSEKLELLRENLESVARLLR